MRDRVSAWLSRLDPAWRHGLVAYVAVRLLLLALAILVVWVYPGTLDPQASSRQRMGIPAVEGPVKNALWGVWLRWDTLWYVRYARDGLLPASHPDYRPFWPLYPWLMRCLSPVLRGDHLKAGLLVSNAALIAAAVLFHKLAEMECDDQVARRGTWYMMLFPAALFLFAAYSESLFLALSLAAFYAARRGRWVWAGVWGGVAAMSRVSGAFLVPAMGVEYLRQRMGARGWPALRDGRWWVRSAIHAWPLLIVVAGVGFLPAYTALFLQGGSVASAIENHVGTVEAGFGLAFPWQVLAQAVRALASGRFFIIQPFDLAMTVIFVALTAVAFIRLPVVYGVYMAVTVVALTSRSIVQHPLIGASRYVGPLFPAYMLLGQIGGRPWVNRLILYPSLLILGFFAAQFMIGGFVG